MFSTVSMAVYIEWSWLLYRCMPLRPTGCTFGRVGLEPRPEHVDVGLVVLVVDRIGLGHPHDVAGLDVGGLHQARAPRAPALPCSIELLVGGGPPLVALVDRVLEAEDVAAVLDHVRRPRAEVLDPHGLDLGVVDVDPVVGPRHLVGGHDEGDREEVAEREVVGRRAAPRRAPAGPWPRSRCGERHRRDDVVGRVRRWTPPARRPTAGPAARRGGSW